MDKRIDSSTSNEWGSHPPSTLSDVLNMGSSRKRFSLDALVNECFRVVEHVERRE